MDSYAKRWTKAVDDILDASKHLKVIDECVKTFDDCGTPRGLQTMDLFGGQGAFHESVKDAGMSCECVDVLRDLIQHDILTVGGFFHILNLLLRLVPGPTKHVS